MMTKKKKKKEMKIKMTKKIYSKMQTNKWLVKRNYPKISLMVVLKLNHSIWMKNVI